MAHECPECAQVCFCDMDDTWFEDPKGGCRHDCDDNFDDDTWDYEDDPDDGYAPGMYVEPPPSASPTGASLDQKGEQS